MGRSLSSFALDCELAVARARAAAACGTRPIPAAATGNFFLFRLGQFIAGSAYISDVNFFDFKLFVFRHVLSKCLSVGWTWELWFHDR